MTVFSSYFNYDIFSLIVCDWNFFISVLHVYCDPPMAMRDSANARVSPNTGKAVGMSAYQGRTKVYSTL